MTKQGARDPCVLLHTLELVQGFILYQSQPASYIHTKAIRGQRQYIRDGQRKCDELEGKAAFLVKANASAEECAFGLRAWDKNKTGYKVERWYMSSEGPHRTQKDEMGAMTNQ